MASLLSLLVNFGLLLGVSESATGSLLAAVGTALPETMLSVVAIVSVLVAGLLYALFISVVVYHAVVLGVSPRSPTDR